MEYSVAKPKMYFFALTISPMSVFLLLTNSFVSLFHLSNACVAMEVFWSSQQRQRRNGSGRANVFFYFPQIPQRNKSYMLMECSGMSEELTPNHHIADQCVLYRKVMREDIKGSCGYNFSLLQSHFLSWM